MSRNHEVNFIKRCIMIVRDQSLHELHFSACKLIMSVNIDELEIADPTGSGRDGGVVLDKEYLDSTTLMDIFLPIITYIQTAVGDYLAILT